MKAINNYYSWCICYIDAAYIEKVVAELDKYPEYEEIEACIPTVKILKKTFKGKQEFEQIPLLFNYGFFKIPRKFAVHHKFLEDLKNNISCIYSWVKDPQKVMEIRPRLRLDKKSVYLENEVPVATCTSEQVARLVKESFNYSAHSAEDLANIKPGSHIILRGYPFEGVNATILKVNDKKQEVEVEINIFDSVRKVMVAYDNVFFTIYHGRNYDDSIGTTQSLDVMVENRTFDKLQGKFSRNERK